MHTWHKGLKLLPKTLLNFSLLLTNHTIQHLKDSLAQWGKEVMGNSGTDTEIFKGSINFEAYKLGMPLQEVLQEGAMTEYG